MGALLQRRTGLPLQLLAAGPGGVGPLSTLAQAYEVQAVIFFRDPAVGTPPAPDFADLLQVCDAQEIPLATNAATATALLYFLHTSPDRGGLVARPWGRVLAAPGPAPARILISTELATTLASPRVSVGDAAPAARTYTPPYRSSG